MMNEDDILLVEDTQQPSYEEKTKKLQKRSREEIIQPIASSDQTSHSSQDTEDSGTSRKKHKKKKPSLESSDASQVISETQLSSESKINYFVPKKNKTKMKHRLKHGSDEEGWSPSTPNKSSQQSPKKAFANAGVVDEDEFWSPSTPKTSSKLPRKEDLGNGSVVDGNMSSQKKKKRKRREVTYVPDGPAKEKAEATSSQRDQMDLDQTIETRMMNEDDILLVEDTQQPSSEEKTKKLQKRSREEVIQPIASSDQTSHSSQDTEDSGTSRKNHKKKSSLETSDASRVISETQLSNESEINNFVPKKNKTKMKHRLKHGSDEEGWSPSTPNKSSQPSPKKALANAGVVDEDEFWSPSTPKTSSKRPQKEDLGNGSLVDGNRSSQKKKKRKQREVVYVPDGPAKEKAEATSSQRDQMDLDQTIETRMMNEDDILLVEDTQQPSSEEKTKKLQKRSREEVKQPIGSSDKTSHSSQDTEVSGTSRKKHKKKKSSLESSDASRVISETQLSNEPEINNFVPKKNKTKLKHRLKHGSDEEGWSPSTPNKSSQLSPKKAFTNAGVVDEDDFWSPSTPKTSSKLPQKEDLGNGSLVDGNRSSQKKKKRKQREVICVPDGPAKEKAEATSSQRDQMDLDQTIETRMMNEDDILLVEDTQQPSSEEKTKKLQKRRQEEVKQPIASSDQTSHSSQDTEDSGTSRKKHKKKKSSLESSDASQVISETQLSNVPEINNFVPKKNKTKMKHRLKHGNDEEGWSPSIPNKSSQPSPKKALANAGVFDDYEFWSPSTPKTSSKLPQKEDLGNGSLVDGNRSSQKKKKRKEREVVYVPDGPAKEKAEATSSQRDQMDLDQTIETRMMNEDILLVEDTQQPSSEEKTKKLQKRSREEAKQPIASSDQTSHSSQDTEDSGTSRKKHKKKKSSLESSDASRVISETQLSNESKINNFVPKKNKTKMKHRLKHGSDEEGWSPSTPNKSSQLSPKKAFANAGVVDEDDFWSPSTPKTSSKLPQKEDLGNGSLVDGYRSSQKKKKRKEREVVYVPDGPAKEKAEATSSQRDQMDLDQTIETRMMNEDILLVEDTQQPSSEEKTKKLQKRSREEAKQPIASSDQTSHSSQDTEDSGTSRKKHKKKKSSLESSDASRVISETQLSNESKINNFVPKKNKTKMKHRLKHGSDEEGWSPSTPNKSSQLSPKKAFANAGVVDEDDFWSPSTPKTSSKLPQKEDLGNGSLVDGNRSSQKKKKRKQREVICVPDGPAKEKAEATSSQRDQMDLDQTIETRMMNEDDILLVEDTQQPSSEEKTKKLQKRRQEEVKQPIASSDQTSHSSQDTEDSGTSRKKHKKKKSSLESSDASQVISETQLSNVPEINNFVPKKNKTKMKHRLKHGNDEEGWSPSIPNKSSQPSPKKALANAGVFDDYEFWSPSTPKTSSKRPQKEDLGNGSLVDGNRSSQKKKKRKQREVVYVPDGPAKEKAEATSSQRDQMDLDQTIETRMMNEDILLVEDTQQPSSEEETKKLQKRRQEEVKQPIGSSDQTSHSSQDTEDSGTSRKKHKKKKSSLESSDASRVISETQLSNEPEINNFVPKKNKTKMKHRLKHGSDEEGWSPSIPNKSSQQSPKKALANAGVFDDYEFWSPSTPKTSSKLPQKEDLGNGSLVDGNRSSQKKKKRKQREVVYVPDGPAKEKAEATSSQRDQMDLDQTIETRMMNEDILLVEDTQQPSSEEETKKLQKRRQEEAKQPIASSDQTSHSSQDTEDSGTSRKKHKKKKSSLESSDASRVISETQLSNESEINNFLPKKSKTKMKHRLKHGSDEEGWSPSTPNKSSQPSPKKALANAGVVDEDDFWSPSTPKTSSKLPQKEDLGNGSVVDCNRSSQKKKKRKEREVVYVPDGPAKEKAEATSSQREVQMDLDQTIDMQMNLFDSPPLSFSVGPQVDRHPGHGQERSRSPTAEDSEATQVDLEMEGTSAADHEQTQPRSPSKLPTLGLNTKLDRTGRKLRSSRKQSPSKTCSEEEEEDAYALDKKQMENARKELEEFIPRAKTLADSAIRQLARRDLARFRELKKKGLAVRFGVFSQAENNLLTENMEAFWEESGIESVEKLLFSNRFPEEKAEIKRLKCQYSFCESIAQGIARPWRLVYYRARKMFDPQNYKGRYTEKEEKQLFKYHTMYENRWEKISELMNRSSHSIALKYSEMVEVSNLGPWTKDETYRLLQTLRDILKAKVKGLALALDNRDSNGALTLLRENLYKNIGWMKVAAQVETRSWRQCKRKWMLILTKKIMGKSHFHRPNNLQFKIDLIKRLYELNVADTSEIDWEHIAGVIGNVPPDYVQNRYYQLKASYVPFWYEKTFPEIIDYLFEETLPTLKETHKRLAQRHRAPQEDRSCKKSFHFDDIFRDMLEHELLNTEDSTDGETGEPSQADV